jgi:hypothetical protein
MFVAPTWLSRCIARRASRWLLDVIPSSAASVATIHCRYIQACVAVPVAPTPLAAIALPIRNQTESALRHSSCTKPSWLASTSTGASSSISTAYYYQHSQLLSRGKCSASIPCFFLPLACCTVCLARPTTLKTLSIAISTPRPARYLTVEPVCSLACRTTQHHQPHRLAHSPGASLNNLSRVANEIWRHPSRAINPRMGTLYVKRCMRRMTWADSTPDNIDYDYLKDLIKHQTTPGTNKAVSIPGQGQSTERAFRETFLQVLQAQHDRINLFVRSKSGEIERRLDHISKSLEQLRLKHRSAPAGTRLPARTVERYAKIDADVTK